MERQAYIFDHLQNPIDSDIEDFVTLIPHLTGRPTDFETIERNLESIRENTKDTATFVHEASETSGLVCAITANRAQLLRPEGWIDDVMTRPEHEGRGLGRAAMGVAHGWFMENGVDLIRLTSAKNRIPARKLYESMGYILDGTVMRSYLDNDNTSDHFNAPTYIDVAAMSELYNLLRGQDAWAELSPLSRGKTYLAMSMAQQIVRASDTTHTVLSRNLDGKITGTASAVSCLIPTGNKAWLYDIRGETVDDQVQVIRDAHHVLRQLGATSVNVMTFDTEVDASRAEAYKLTGYEIRSTGLFTLDLSR